MDIKFSLNAFHLKVIAMIFMFIDHFGVMVLNPMIFPWSLGWYIPARIAGRIAFPIFAFLVVEAVLHTRNISRYWLRLSLMAVSIGIAMWLLTTQFNIVLFSGNIFIDLLLGSIVIYGLNKPQKNIFFILILPIYLLVENFLPSFFQADYGTYGWFLMIIYWFARQLALRYDFFNLPKNISSSMIAAFILFGLHAIWFFASVNASIDPPIQSFALLAAPMIGFYNGLPGHQSQAFKIFSYGFYPLHFGVIYVILIGLMYFGF